MVMLSNAKRRYALADYTAENNGGKWYYWRTARFGDKEERKGPYGSTASVTLMIARDLKRDLVRRDKAHELPT
jgi:hypothetical protein